MKVQEVILKAMAGSLKWSDAAEIIGISDRSLRRWRERYQEHGYDGLYDRRKRRPSPKRVPMEDAERVLQLYREKYFDFNVRHFHEKLVEEHGIRLSYTWVKLALQGAHLVDKQKRRGTHRRRRPRRPLPGMLLHIDASKHAWFQDGRYYDLITILDDATSEIYYAQLVEEEGTRTLMPAVRKVIETQGHFCALYSDRAPFFRDAQSRRQGGFKSTDAVGTGVAGAGDQNDSGLLAAGAGTHGEELPHLAGPAAAGVADASDPDGGASQPFSAGTIPGGIQPALQRACGREGQCLRTHPAQGFGVGILDPAGAHRQRGQHHCVGQSHFADRKDTLAQHPGRMQGDRLRTSARRHYGDTLWAARGGALRPR